MEPALASTSLPTGTSAPSSSEAKRLSPRERTNTGPPRGSSVTLCASSGSGALTGGAAFSGGSAGEAPAARVVKLLSAPRDVPSSLWATTR